jgi:DNA-binding transcriptional ArsR family regulator
VSNEMLNRAWRLRLRLRLSERLLLVALADRCNGVGICWPSVADLAARTGLKPRAVRNLLRRLERRKLIDTTPRDGRTSKYRLRLLAPASNANTPAPGDRGTGQSSAVNTPARRCPHPGTAVPPNPQEPTDSTVGEGIETSGSSRSGAGGGARKLAARRRRR